MVKVDYGNFNASEDSVNYNVVTNKVLDSLLQTSNNVLLTISRRGCFLCEVVKQNPIFSSLQIAQYSIDIETSNSNKLISQALHTTGFPMSWVIDKRLNLVGVIYGVDDFDKKLEAILLKENCVVDDIFGVNPKNTLTMLNYSFKAALSLIDEDPKIAYDYAHLSLSKGEYFFNNFIIYKYHNIMNVPDSTAYYKTKTLLHSIGVDKLIYESLIKEIDPDFEVHHHSHHKH